MTFCFHYHKYYSLPLQMSCSTLSKNASHTKSKQFAKRQSTLYHTYLTNTCATTVLFMANWTPSRSACIWWTNIVNNWQTPGSTALCCEWVMLELLVSLLLIVMRWRLTGMHLRRKHIENHMFLLSQMCTRWNNKGAIKLITLYLIILGYTIQYEYFISD